MPTATTSNAPGRPATVVLGRYRTGRTTRTLYARRKGPWTYIADEPAKTGSGAIYAVEEIPDGDGEGAIDALAADYLAEARKARSIRMAHTIIDAPYLPEAA